MNSTNTSWKTPLSVMKIAALGLIGILLIGVYLKTEQNIQVLGPSKSMPRLKEYSNTPIDLSSFDFPKSEYLLVSFWATWCPTCKSELNQLQHLNTSLKDPRLKIISVNLDPLKDQQKALQVWQSLNLDLTLILGSEKPFLKIFEIQVLPSYFLIKDNNSILWRLDGATDWSSDQTINLLKKHIP